MVTFDPLILAFDPQILAFDPQILASSPKMVEESKSNQKQPEKGDVQQKQSSASDMLEHDGIYPHLRESAGNLGQSEPNRNLNLGEDLRILK